MKSRLAVSFNEVADRERKYPGEGASGIRGAQAFLGRLTLGPAPVETIRLGRLARGTEPMVPIILNPELIN